MGKAAKNLAAFAAGVGSGYMTAADKVRRDRIEDEDRAIRNEEITLRRDRVRREENDQIALRQAGMPATVSDGLLVPNDDEGNPMPSTGQSRVTLGDGSSTYHGSRAEAEAAAAKHNDPIALSNRVAGVLTAQGKPTEAMKFQQEAEQFANQRWQQRLREAVSGGHAGLAKLVTESDSGVFKGKQVVPQPSADGKTVTYAVIGPDGTPQPTQLTFPNDERGVIEAAYKLDRSVPIDSRYKLMVENDRKQHEADRKDRELTLRERNLEEVQKPLAEARAGLAEARATAAEARAAAASAKGGNSDKASREERLRWTSLHGEAGRRLSEAQKSLRTLQSDQVFMSQASRNPNSEQARQLANVKEDVEQYKADREMYGGLLAGSQGAEARAARDAQPKPNAKPAASAMPAPATKADYDKLPSGTKYRHPDGTVKVKP